MRFYAPLENGFQAAGVDKLTYFPGLRPPIYTRHNHVKTMTILIDAITGSDQIHR